jgi:2-polyprenyl-6-methoxyphenol hydroxylase-like FAD-dependent oxidoreductase
MRLTDLNVIVAGAGTGGCATALLLARAGARVTIVERVPQPRAVGAGIAMAENGLAVLESLGLLPSLEAAGCTVSGGRVTDAAGRTLLVPPAPEPRILMVRRATLQGLLIDALADTAGVERRFGAEVLRASTDGTVTVRDEAGTAVSTADLVIGADGVHSRVRDGGAFGARVRRSGISYVRMLVRAGLETNCEAWTAAGIFGAFPVDGGTYAFASCGSPECRAALADRNVRAFRAAWASVYPPAAPILADVATFDDLIVNEVIQVDCDRWVDGRLVLLGDAAHAMAPNVGQGANSALVDAAVLLDELRQASSVSDALTAYERRRRPRVKRVATMAARLGRVAEWTNPVARAMRDRVLVPMANMVATPGATAMLLQEPTARLVAIGRA